MINTVIVTGKPAAGKSKMVNHMKDFFAEDGIRVAHIADRTRIEDAVLLDVVESPVNDDGSRVGQYSKLLFDGGPERRKFDLLDGYLLNTVHEGMIRDAAVARSSSQITLMEYAIGPVLDYGQDKPPLLQTAEHLVKAVRANDILDTTLIIEVDANMEVRGRRNAQRPDFLLPEIFKVFAPDGGEVDYQTAQELGNHYVKFLNEEDDSERYQSKCREIYRGNIFPHLPREGSIRPESYFPRKER